MVPSPILSSFFFNDTATTEIYTLSLHDALPIYRVAGEPVGPSDDERRRGLGGIRRRAGLPEQHRGAEEEDERPGDENPPHDAHRPGRQIGRASCRERV